MPPSRSSLLALFSGRTGRTVTTPRIQGDPSIQSMLGYTPSYARDLSIRGGIPVPDFRPSGFEGIDAELVDRLERVERGRQRSGRGRRD